MMNPTNHNYDAFVAHIILTLPELDIEISDVQFTDGHIVITRGDESVAIDIEPFERAYRRRPDAVDAVLSTLLRVSRGEKGIADPGYNAIANQIIPQLKPIALLAELVERGAEPIIYRLFLADLIITYAIHDGNRLSYLTETQLARWNVSEHTVHAQAITNLHNRSQHVPYHKAGSASQQVIVFNVNDGLDAARILLPDIILAASNDIPGDIVIGIPNRDFLVIISADDPDRVAAVALQITRDMRQHAHGLSNRLFTIHHNEVREYTEA
ncbi:MAG: DUF1444 family protein [Chloroflexia bacterium]|nr:DUF1444 family protein [Chloroflexia bacterium]